METIRAAALNGLRARNFPGPDLEACARLIAQGAIKNDEDGISMALWMHHRVLLGDLGATHNSNLGRFWAHITRDGRPPGHLPLRRLEAEQDFVAAMATLSGPPGQGRCGWAYSLAGVSDYSPQDIVRVLAPTLQLTPAPVPNEISLHFAGWMERSNGYFETASFWVKPPLVSLDPAAVAGLPFIALDDANKVTAATVSLPQVLTLLFGHLLHGGAYGGGMDSTMARLGAWKTVAALAGVESNVSVLNIEQSMAGASFVLFESDSSFFKGVAWDFGIACLAPGGCRLTLLAGTDSD